MRPAYYNEHDPYAAQWLRNLIVAGHIAPGDVDERDIRDVRASDFDDYGQCHFFAGIGGWSLALRLAGVPDDEPVWTGSCPCQPFSAAGKGGGFDDERHLWPAFFHLIGECRPATIFGEQVAARAGLDWFDLVSADLEEAGYAVGASDLCAAGVGAPHIRQRLWWVANANSSGQREQRSGGILDRERTAQRNDADGCGTVRGVGNAERERPGRHTGAGAEAQGGAELRAERHDARASGFARPAKKGGSLDGNEKNNRPGNLEWASHVRNMQDKKYHKSAVGFILTPRSVAEIKERMKSYYFGLHADLATEFRVTRATISDIKAGRSHADV